MADSWDLSSMRTRRGGPRRLLGLKIYYDFRWTDVFPDRRAQFRNGLSLARLATREAPDGKAPALLLTANEAADRTPVETDHEYILVVRIHDYLKLDHADAASTYFADTIGTGIASLSRFSDLAESPELLQLFLDEHLTTDLIAKWASVDAERVADLSQALGRSPDPKADVTIEDAIASFERFDDIEWEALLDALGVLIEEDQWEHLARVTTGDRTGRRATIHTIGNRIAERLQDLELAASEYDELVSSGVTETELHAFLQETPWLLGMDYVRVRSKVNIPRGELDFVLDRFDGYFDVLELKGPADPIVIAPEVQDGVPPPASTYRLGPSLAAALAQIHFYRDALSGSPQHLSSLYGLNLARSPRFIIVIGRDHDLQPHQRTVLEQLNQTLHRVEILPYDLVAKRAQTWLNTLREILSLTED